MLVLLMKGKFHLVCDAMSWDVASFLGAKKWQFSGGVGFAVKSTTLFVTTTKHCAYINFLIHGENEGIAPCFPFFFLCVCVCVCFIKKKKKRKKKQRDRLVYVLCL